jgi:glycosyltransferase involved in cell wall biosynthesis
VLLSQDWHNGTSTRVLPRPLLFTLKGLRVLARDTSNFSSLSQTLDTLVLQRFLKRHNVDVVLAEYGLAGVQIMDVCHKANIPLVVHFHGYDAYNEAVVLQFYRESYRRLFTIARAIIAVSRDMEHQLMSLGAPRDRVFYNVYGVDSSRFSLADPSNSPPLFVAVGRFVDKKAPHLTLLAFQKVVPVCPEARLVMIGDGLLWDACKMLVKALHLEQQVTFTGPQPHSEVAATMQQARAFVQHSIRPGTGDSEGTPVAVLEAGMAGLPVVSTRHAGIKDVVREGETGFLVDEGDIDSMADHMIRLAQDAPLAGRIGQQAHEHIKAHFSMERSIGNLWEIIERACKG